MIAQSVVDLHKFGVERRRRGDTCRSKWQEHALTCTPRWHLGAMRLGQVSGSLHSKIVIEYIGILRKRMNGYVENNHGGGR